MTYRHPFNAIIRIQEKLLDYFQVLAKCSNKFDYPTKEMLFIRQQKPELGVQLTLLQLLNFLVNFKPVPTFMKNP